MAKRDFEEAFSRKRMQLEVNPFVPVIDGSGGYNGPWLPYVPEVTLMVTRTGVLLVFRGRFHHIVRSDLRNWLDLSVRTEVHEDKCRRVLLMLAALTFFPELDGYRDAMALLHNSAMHALNGNTSRKLEKRELAKLRAAAEELEQIRRATVRVARQKRYEEDPSAKARYEGLEVDGVLYDVMEAVIYGKPANTVMGVDGKPMSQSQFNHMRRVLDHKNRLRVEGQVGYETLKDYATRAMALVTEAYQGVKNFLASTRRLYAGAKFVGKIAMEILEWIKDLEGLISFLIEAVANVVLLILLIKRGEWDLLLLFLMGKYASMVVPVVGNLMEPKVVIEQLKSLFVPSENVHYDDLDDDEDSREMTYVHSSRIAKHGDGVYRPILDSNGRVPVIGQIESENVFRALYHWCAAFLLGSKYDMKEANMRADYLSKSMGVVITGKRLVDVLITIGQDVYGFACEKMLGVGNLKFVDEVTRDEMIQIMKETRMIAAMNLPTLTEHEMDFAMNTWKRAAKVQEILVASREPHANIAPFMHTCVALEKVQAHINSVRSYKPGRAAAVQLTLMGKSGIGKSFVQLPLMAACLSEYYGKPVEADKIFTRNGKDQYMDGWNSQHLGMIRDDFFQSNDPALTMSDALDTIMYGSNATYYPVCANMDKKVNNEFRARLICGSANRFPQNIGIQQAEAFYGRLDVFKVIPANKDDVILNDLRAIWKPNTRKSDFSHLRFERLRFIRAGKGFTYMPADAKPMTFDEVVGFIVERMKQEETNYQLMGDQTGTLAARYAQRNRAADKQTTQDDKGKQKETNATPQMRGVIDWGKKKFTTMSVSSKDEGIPAAEKKPEVDPEYAFYLGVNENLQKRGLRVELSDDDKALLHKSYLCGMTVDEAVTTLAALIEAQEDDEPVKEDLLEEQKSIFSVIAAKVEEMRENPKYLMMAAVAGLLATAGAVAFGLYQVFRSKDEPVEGQAYSDGQPREHKVRPQNKWSGRLEVVGQSSAREFAMDNSNRVEVMHQIGMDKNKHDQVVALYRNKVALQFDVEEEDGIGQYTALATMDGGRCIHAVGHLYGLLKDKKFRMMVCKGSWKAGPFTDQDVKLRVLRRDDGYDELMGIVVTNKRLQEFPSILHLYPDQTIPETMMCDVVQIIPDSSTICDTLFFVKIQNIGTLDYQTVTRVGGEVFIGIKSLWSDGHQAPGYCGVSYVTLNPKSRALVLAEHYAVGPNGRAFMRPIIQQDLLHLYGADYPNVERIQQPGIGQVYGVKPDGAYPKKALRIGLTDQKHKSMRPLKSKLRPSLVFDPDHAPTAPAPLDVVLIDGERVDPFRKAIEKWDVTLPTLSDEALMVLRAATKIQKDKIMRCGTNYHAPLDEGMILGTTPNGKKRPVDRNTSLGFNKVDFPGIGKKGAVLLNGDQRSLTPKFREHIQKLDEQRRKGNLVYIPMLATLKDELLLKEKVALGKARLFMAGAFEDAYLDTKYLYAFDEAVLGDMSIGYVGFIDPTGTNWLALYDHITRFGDEVWSFDIEKNDVMFNAEVRMAAHEIQLDWLQKCNYTAEDLLAAKTCLELKIQPHVSFNGTVVQLNGSLTSGDRATLRDNTMCNQLEISGTGLALLLEHGLSATATNLDDLMCSVHYGDDSLIAKNSAKYPWMTAGAFTAKHFKLWGRTLTMTSKDGKPVDSIKIRDAEFLSRGFRMVEGALYAPLKETTCYGMTNYYVDNGMDPVVLTLELVDAALREWFHYGRTRFVVEKKRLNALLRDAGIAESSLSFDELQRAWHARR